MHPWWQQCHVNRLKQANAEVLLYGAKKFNDTQRYHSLLQKIKSNSNIIVYSYYFMFLIHKFKQLCSCQKKKIWKGIMLFRRIFFSWHLVSNALHSIISLHKRDNIQTFGKRNGEYKERQRERHLLQSSGISFWDIPLSWPLRGKGEMVERKKWV